MVQLYFNAHVYQSEPVYYAVNNILNFKQQFVQVRFVGYGNNGNRKNIYLQCE